MADFESSLAMLKLQWQCSMLNPKKLMRVGKGAKDYKCLSSVLLQFGPFADKVWLDRCHSFDGYLKFKGWMGFGQPWSSQTAWTLLFINFPRLNFCWWDEQQSSSRHSVIWYFDVGGGDRCLKRCPKKSGDYEGHSRIHLYFSSTSAFVCFHLFRFFLYLN